MHGISSKSSNIYSMIIKNMTIEPIIMPHFFILLILHIVFKIIEQSCIGTKIINKNFGSVSKIVLWSCKKWGANYLPFAHRWLIFYIQVHSLCIPCYTIFNFLKLFNTPYTLLRSSNNCSPKVFIHNFGLNFFKCFIIKFASIDFVKSLFGRASNPRWNPKFLDGRTECVSEMFR